MGFRIVRNDIIKMETEAIVNTANDHPTVGTGCDYAVYNAAGFDELLKYREEKIGFVEEGEVFITPGFNLKQKYIIHAVSPHYVDGKHGEDEKLHSCYRDSLYLAKEHGIKSIAFPLISTGGFGYPKVDGIRIAVDEIYDFLFDNDMDIYLVVFDAESVQLGEKIQPNLKAYIDQNYVCKKEEEEFGGFFIGNFETTINARYYEPEVDLSDVDNEDILVAKLADRVSHKSDTFAEYLLYLIKRNGFTNSEVYSKACVTRQRFSKIINGGHPQKLTALQLCVGAELSMDDTKDLLARAGYAFSSCDLTDIIFSFFIENEIYDMFELDIQLGNYGLPTIIE